MNHASIGYNLAGFVEGPTRMLMSFEVAVPFLLVSPIPGEAVGVVVGGLVTAVTAQWRASRKDQADWIAAITKSTSTMERLVPLVENVAKEQAEIKVDIKDGARELAELRRQLIQPPTGSGARRASNG